MNVAFLFNASHEDFGGIYGDPIRQHIMSLGILQKCQRSKRFAEGDIITLLHSKTYADYKTRTLEALSGTEFHNVDLLKISRLLPNITICVFLIQNMTEQTALEMHEALKFCDWYLGAKGIVFSNPVDLGLIRNSLVERGRIEGTKCYLFSAMGEDISDPYLIEEFENMGFEAKFVDNGARRTIFDNYDNLEHFVRIHDFSHVLNEALGLEHEVISDFVHVTEEINPRLFETAYSATFSLINAQTDDQIAQAGLSCRRFLKLLTDTWYPAKNTTSSTGRELKDNHVKNRFWSYLEESLCLKGSTLTKHGKKFDKMWEASSKYLHIDHPNKEDVFTLLANVLTFTTRVIYLDTEKAARPYKPYEGEISDFLQLKKI